MGDRNGGTPPRPELGQGAATERSGEIDIRAAAAVPWCLGITWHWRAAEPQARKSVASGIRCCTVYLPVKCPSYLTKTPKIADHSSALPRLVSQCQTVNDNNHVAIVTKGPYRTGILGAVGISANDEDLPPNKIG